jgi:hypothetical protein
LEQRAAKGDAEAQYRLGSEFAKGNSRQLDKVEAYKWLRLAVENGCKDASALRAKVGASLSPDEVREAMRRSRLVTGGEPDLGPSSASGFVCFLVVTGGQTVIAGRENGNIELISYTTGEILKSLMGHTATLQALAITPDGKLLASAGDDKSIKLWSVPGGELLKTLTGHVKKVNALAISPDGKLLASGSDDKTIRLWALPDGKELFCLMDLGANYRTAEGITYKSENQFGQAITYTLPCGSPIPPGAVCVCNCVPGSLAMPTGHTQQFAGTVCTCDLICTCNTVCTCQSVGNRGGGYSYYVSYWYPN